MEITAAAVILSLILCRALSWRGLARDRCANLPRFPARGCNPIDFVGADTSEARLSDENVRLMVILRGW